MARLSPVLQRTGNAGAAMRAPGQAGATRGAMIRAPDSPSVAAPKSRSSARISPSLGMSCPRALPSAAVRLAEGEGFEPSRRLDTPYSLSRRALSAAQSSLRVGPKYTEAGIRSRMARRARPRRSDRAVPQVPAHVAHHHDPSRGVQIAVDPQQLSTGPADVRAQLDRASVVAALVVGRELLARRVGDVARPVEAARAGLGREVGVRQPVGRPVG